MTTKFSAIVGAGAISASDKILGVQAGPTDVVYTFTTASAQIATILGLAITAGKTFTVTNTLTLSGTDGSTLTIGAGGTLTALAFTAPGTGVATALGVNVGSAGAFITFNGNAGTPSALVGTNITGTAAGLTAGTVTTNANLTGDVTSSGNVTTLATAQPGAHTWSAAQTVSSASFGLSGAISAAAWTTSGIRYKNVAATLTDTSSSGTVAAAYTDVWGGNTIAASSAATFTNYYGSYFVAPIAGTNVTFTNGWALGADSALINGNIKSTGLIIGQAGSAAAPSHVVGNATTGLYSVSTTGLGFAVNGVRLGDYGIAVSGQWNLSNGVETSAGGFYSFAGRSFTSSTADGNLLFKNAAGSNVLTLSWPASATWQLGAADVASGAVAQFIRAQSNTGASTTGPDFTWQGTKGTTIGGALVLQTALTTTYATALKLTPAQAVLALSPTGGLGYGTGAGGTVTQITSKSTGVTLNTVTGQITMNNANLAGQTEVSFTLTNSAIAATDVVLVSIASGATANSYIVGVAATAAGSCVIQLGNVTLATTLGEAVVLNFVVIKGVTS